MKTLPEIIELVKTAEKSLQEEALGNLDGNRTEGLLCIANDLKEIKRYLVSLEKKLKKVS